MPLSPAQPLEVRTKSSWNPTYWIAATVRNTSGLTRDACDIYEEIDNADPNTWSNFQLDRVNELRMLWSLSTGEGGANVFRGGHVVLSDNAAWYYHWATLLGANPNMGS